MSEVLAELDAAVRPLTRREYEQLTELGAFQDEPIELLEGWLVQMSPEGSRHRFVITWLNNHLVPQLAPRLLVSVGHPFAASDLSEPEPDLAIIEPLELTPDRHTAVARLLIEVSYSSRRRDLGLKLAIYARAGVPEYWVVDLHANQVLIHRDPAGDAYATVTHHGADETLDACGAAVPLATILAPVGD